MSADRNLLFGVLALQLGFIKPDQFVAAIRASQDEGNQIADVLEFTKALSTSDRRILDAVFERTLELRGNVREQTISTLVPVDIAAARRIAEMAPSEILATLSINGLRSPALMPQTVTIGQTSSGSGRFRVVRFHAEGGLGQISVAQDTELDREIALKEIKPAFAHDDGSRGRFVLEAQITGGLEHPGIVPVYGLGNYPDGRPFYAMRFIQGDTLEVAINRFHDLDQAKGRNESDLQLELRQLLARFIAVCNAVEYSHSRGVLHRDLKPRNIMLGKYGETLVVDWGLAKAVGWNANTTDDDSEPPLRPTAAKSLEETIMGDCVGGTLQYISPEQFAGKHDQTGPGTDIFALGATLYHMLTGKTVYHSATRENLPAHIREARFPTPRSVNRSIAKPLEAICLKALAAQPSERYSSAHALLKDVELFLADEPVSAYREPASTRARRWARKRPGLVSGTLATILVTVIALLGGTVILTQKNRELAEREQIATAIKNFLLNDVLQLASPDNQASAGLQVDPELKLRALLTRGQRLLAEGRLSNAPAAQIELQTVLDRGTHSVDTELTVLQATLLAASRAEYRFTKQPHIEAEVRATIGGALAGVGEFALALPHLERVLQLHTRASGANHPKALAASNYLSGAYSSAGRSDKAIALGETTQSRLAAQLGPDHPETLYCMYNLAKTYHVAGRRKEAASLFAETYESMRAQLGPNDLHTLRAMGSLAGCHFHAGRLAESVSLFEKTRKLMEAALGSDHPDTLRLCDGLAIAYQGVGRLNEAIALLEELLPLIVRKLGAEHPDSIRVMNDLADACRDAGALDQSVELFERALDLRKNKLGLNHPDTLASMNNLASAFLLVGRTDEAMLLSEESVRLMRSKKHPHLAQQVATLADTYRAAGRVDEAIALYEESLQVRVADHGRSHPETLALMNSLGLAYGEIGHYEKEIQLHQEILQHRRGQLGKEHIDTLGSMNNLALALARADRAREAFELFAEALAIRKAIFDPAHHDTLRTLGGLALMEVELKMYESAEEHLREAFESAGKLPSTMQQQFRAGISSQFIELYEAWPKPQEVAKWREELEKWSR